ncbi:DUF2752 domain-containing protein [Kitasatospora sp. CMC57]|uniref:DUF2752 domain-containing protein n=1 Tax=Kitasatospora sp. CMC57 TaxID=3231513 RepID=UPI0038B6B1F2
MSGTDRLRAAALPPAVSAAGAVGAWHLRSRDPHLAGQLLPFCPWHRLTGLACPACGATRMTYDLLHGDLAAAWADNAALLLALPLLAVLYGNWVRHGLAGRRFRVRLGPRGTVAVLAVAVVWTVGRNLW